MRKKLKLIIILIFIIVTIPICIIYFYALFMIPSQITILKGEEYICDLQLPISIKLFPEKQVGLQLNNNDIITTNIKLGANSSFRIKSNNSQKIEVKVALLGIIPLKTMVINILPNINLIPCGNTIGVKIYTEGVLVIGTSKISDINGKIFEPYKSAGINPGDYIIEIDNKKITNVSDIIKIMETTDGSPLPIKILKNGVLIEVQIKPIKSNKHNKFMLGLWVRDSTAGIGTLTFYDPKSQMFGALGHGITDIDTGTLINVNKGEIINSNVISVKKGLKGIPGELRGIFLENKGKGYILKNTECGIFGIIPNRTNLVPNTKPIPIGLRHQIKNGPAQIITNLSGNSINIYNIEIQQVFRESKNPSKSMLIKVTDKRLLNYTGGIVQGMSGSPIIQNGRLIGAVTHVLVNDPSKGYGVFIEWMLQQITDLQPNILSNAS